MNTDQPDESNPPFEVPSSQVTLDFFQVALTLTINTYFSPLLIRTLLRRLMALEKHFQIYFQVQEDLTFPSDKVPKPTNSI